MLFKFIKKLKEDSKIIGRIYSGKEVLNVPHGTILVVQTSLSDFNSLGDAIKRIENRYHPFMTIIPNSKKGTLWGNQLENYEFKVIALNEEQFFQIQ